jgi:DNA topoisomerase-6 subunit B
LAKTKITSSSTAEYFAKNLQQVGFSSPTKAVLTTLKEAVDNSLDACEEEEILPALDIVVKKIGAGGSKNTDLIEITVEDNGPGLDPEMLPKVFGEYLASSTFGRGRCTRGQQGIGISAATTWAQLTNASGVIVQSKTSKMKKAVRGQVDVDIKGNRGILKHKETVDWNKPHGTKVTFKIDGRIQLNGDGGLLTYLEGTTLMNPHLEIKYKLLDAEPVTIKRVSEETPDVPGATLPHPHTMKLGEFITHAGIYGKMTFSKFLTSAFSRVQANTINDFIKNGMPKGLKDKSLTQMKEADFKAAYQAIQATELQAPSTRSVLTVGEEALSKSVMRLGDIDFFSVVARKPTICDFKPVVVEVALARFNGSRAGGDDDSIQLLRFANRVPLQFDKGACAITKAVESVNWRSYGLQQSKNNLPQGPYVFAISLVSPFIKFKNASKETIDASDELVEEIRLAVMRAGQKLSRHISHETKAADLERKIQHIEQFGPILVETLARLTDASDARKKKAEAGLEKILGRDSKAAEKDLDEAGTRLQQLRAKMKERGIIGEEYLKKSENGEQPESEAEVIEHEEAAADAEEAPVVAAKSKKKKGSKESKEVDRV